MTSNPIKALRNLDDIILAGTQKVVDKAHKHGYDKWDLMQRVNLLEAGALVSLGVYTVIEGLYDSNNGWKLGAGALCAAVGVMSHKWGKNSIERKKTKELHLLESGLAHRIPQSSALRSSMSIFSLSYAAFYLYSLASGQDVSVFDAFSKPTTDPNIQLASKLGSFMFYAHFVAVWTNSYVDDTFGKPPAKQKQSLFDKLKQGMYSILPHKQPVPIPIDNK